MIYDFLVLASDKMLIHQNLVPCSQKMVMLMMMMMMTTTTMTMTTMKIMIVITTTMVTARITM